MLKSSPERDAFLRDVLRYFACKSPAALAQMMHDASPELASGAAHLLLDGHESAPGRPGPAISGWGASFVANPKPVVKSQREAKPMQKEMQPLRWSDLGRHANPVTQLRPGSPDFMASIQRTLATHHRMIAMCGSPTATPHMKIAAIQEWIEVLDASGMGDIVPDEFRNILKEILR